MCYGKKGKFEDLVGQTLVDVVNHGNYELIFTVEGGKSYIMHHDQDCCESVTIEDISGELSDLIGHPILIAEEVANSDDAPLPDSGDSYTWTFYKLATVKGHVTIRWYGTSNGCYSESVDFHEK